MNIIYVLYNPHAGGSDSYCCKVGDIRRYDKVWIAPTMHDCFYGGGMKPAPKQNRKDREMVDVFSGHDITVEFDRPTALQIDGETILGVTEYRVHNSASAEKTTLVHRRTAS